MGQVYSDRYEILQQLGQGGIAELYLARDKLLSRRVALKVLFRELSSDRSYVQRVSRAARSAANLSHPNIVSVFDWGEDHKAYFFVMEYVDGRSLSALLGSQGAMQADRAATIGADVAAALHFAHRNTVVHGDVKPNNVLLDASDRAKVTDFGIAQAAAGDRSITASNLKYSSPEQTQGYGVDARSDVYSLGAVLYEMVTGQPPFVGDNPLIIAYRQVREDPEPLRMVNPAIPAALEAIVLKAMAKDPADRYITAEELQYITAEELQADLVRFGQGQPTGARPVTAKGKSPRQQVLESKLNTRSAPRPEDAGVNCDVFISYAREDRAAAARVAEVIVRATKLKVWWDREILAGTWFDRIIEQNLDSAGCVVVLWSAYSAESDWVRAEAREGASRRILVPAMLGRVRVPLEFRGIHTADLSVWLTNDDDDGIRALIDSINKKMESD